MAALYDDQLDAVTYAKDLLAADTKARIDMLATQAMSGAVLTVNSTSNITGAKAEWIVMDDMYKPDPIEEYEKVSRYIGKCMNGIMQTTRHLEEMKYERFKSPYHPWQAVRWFQKRSARFWYWALAMPVILPLVWVMVAGVWQSTGSLFWTSMTGYTSAVLIGACIKFFK